LFCYAKIEKIARLLFYRGGKRYWKACFDEQPEKAFHQLTLFNLNAVFITHT
jgi:hypothetical protein